MTAHSRKYVAASAILIVSVFATYLFTAGHALLPLAKPTNFTGERIEMRSYSPPILPLQEKTWNGTWEQIKWRLLHPGQARLIRAAQTPSGQLEFQAVLEKLGYAFPENCFALAGQRPSTTIQHYPSMLRRIEKDMHMKGKTISIGVENQTSK